MMSFNANGECCPGDFNPFRPAPVCRGCGDLKVVSRTRFFRRSDDPGKSDMTKCPVCDGGTKGYRKTPPPGITTSELSDSERAQFREWRAQGLHDLDCLRWIEGARYEPEKDPTFVAEAERAMAKWRFLSGRA